MTGRVEELVGDDVLAFAGLQPARVSAISKTQQFAEKVHAYTLAWTDRENTRVKDLVDLLLLVDRGSLDMAELRAAVEATFRVRAKQVIPTVLPPPPASWVAEFRALAVEANVSPAELMPAFERLSTYWNALHANKTG